MGATKAFKAWGVDNGEGRLLGIYYFQFRMKHAAESWNRGCATALFGTRAEARKHLIFVKGPKERGKLPKAKVVRVSGLLAW